MTNPTKLSIVVSCIDYRFWPQALPLLQQKYGDFDLIEVAGSCKNLTSPLEAEDKTTLLENIGISIKLHDPHQIILTNHIDCGAYGGSANFSSHIAEVAFQTNELAKAKAIIEEEFPQLVVVTELLLMEDEHVILQHLQ